MRRTYTLTIEVESQHEADHAVVLSLIQANANALQHLSRLHVEHTDASGDDHCENFGLRVTRK